MSKSQDVVNFRRRIKTALVESFGNKCQVCGVSYPQSVYDFHHLNPAEKEFCVGAQSTTRSKADTAREAKKCIMVCANCHRLIEHEELNLNGVVCAFDETIYYFTLDELTGKNKEIIESRPKPASKKPSREVLKEQIRNTPFLQLGKMYEVSDNAVRKWCKSYNLPSRTTDIKNISDEEWVNI